MLLRFVPTYDTGALSFVTGDAAMYLALAPFFVGPPGSGAGAIDWGDIGGTLADQADLNTALGLKAPLANPTFTGVPAAPTATGGTNTTQIATTAFVDAAVNAIIAAADAMVFKGVVDCSANPNYPAADRGWTYKVSVAGKIGGASGVNVEAGDTLICLTDGTAAGDHATVGAQWNITQANLDGAVIGPASSVDGYFALFSGPSGKLLTSVSPTAVKAALAIGISDVSGLQTALDAKVSGPASATDNALVRFDLATGELVQNSTVLLDDNGQFSIPAVTLSSPSSGINFGAVSQAGVILPSWIQNGMALTRALPLDWHKLGWYGSNSNSIALDGAIALSATGTVTTKAWAATNVYTRAISTEHLVAVAATNAVAGYRYTTAMMTVGGGGANQGGFYFKSIWGPATGVATATTRAFWGIRAATGAPTDVEPSSLISMVGMGWDAADTNIQMMSNDGSGTATKIDLGASFPVPSSDRSEIYQIELFSPPGTTQSVTYRVVRMSTGAVATGTITTNLPTAGQILTFNTYMSAGGTSSVIGVAIERIEVYLFQEIL